MNETSGFLLLDKPEGWSTFDLIRDIRKKSGMRKFGHTGTLDPFATGLVILCAGNFTRLSSLLLGKEKEYLVEMELGVKRDSGDVTGEIIEEKESPQLNEEKLLQGVSSILKITSQKPPRFSAVKVNGKRAYKLARMGEEFELAAKEIRVHSFEICSYQNNLIKYRTLVSKGTYIRTLTETFAEFLGTLAYTKSLRRMAIGKIPVTEAIIPGNINEENWRSFLQPVEKILQDYPEIILNEQQSRAFIHGQKISLSGKENDGEYLIFATDNDKDREFLGSGLLNEGLLHPRKVLA